MKRLMSKMASMTAALALIITAGAVNSACLLLMHQPELPEGANSLRKM